MEPKHAAQRRVDRIAAFRAELAQLENEGALTLDATQQTTVAAYHADLLERLAREHDVDLTGGQKQLSLGMRIVSFLGALALSAAVFFFFYRFWGGLSLPVQVAILLVAPLLATGLTALVARRERTLYFTSLLALVALACFILNLVVLGSIFNITPSQNAFLAWGLFALLLAYAYGLRLLQVAGMFCLGGYLAASVGTWSGCYWLSFGERPENFIVAGAVLTLIPLLPIQRQQQFANGYRVFGLLAVFIAILILANWGEGSYFAITPRYVEYLYQATGFIVAGGVIALGIRKRWAGVTNLGSTFFTLYLYTKFYDWWWEWLPRYLFFLLLGLVAIALLLLLKRLHGVHKEVMA